MRRLWPAGYRKLLGHRWWLRRITLYRQFSCNRNGSKVRAFTNSLRSITRAWAGSADGMNLSKTRVPDDLSVPTVRITVNERLYPCSAVPCSRILNEMYTELEVSRSHETTLDKATLTCRSADRKVISGQPAE